MALFGLGKKLDSTITGGSHADGDLMLEPVFRIVLSSVWEVADAKHVALAELSHTAAGGNTSSLAGARGGGAL